MTSAEKIYEIINDIIECNSSWLNWRIKVNDPNETYKYVGVSFNNHVNFLEITNNKMDIFLVVPDDSQWKLQHETGALIKPDEHNDLYDYEDYFNIATVYLETLSGETIKSIINAVINEQLQILKKINLLKFKDTINDEPQQDA